MRAAIALVLLMPAGVQAQAISCRIPQRLPSPQPESPGVRRIVPVGGYTLALSWSPQYCRTRGGDTGNSFQCSGGFGFVLHGLWPDGRGDMGPQYCRAAGLVPEPVVRETLCVTPSAARLLISGLRVSCTGLSAIPI